MESTPKNHILVCILRNLEGLSDPAEIAMLNAWIEDSKYNKRYFEQVRNLWALSFKGKNLQTTNSAKAMKLFATGSVTIDLVMAP